MTLTMLNPGLILKNLTAENPIHADEQETHNEPTFTMRGGYIWQNGTNGSPATTTTGGGGTQFGGLLAPLNQFVPQAGVMQMVLQQNPTQSPAQSPVQQSPVQSPVQRAPMKVVQVKQAAPTKVVQAPTGPTPIKVTPQARVAGTLDGIVDFLSHCVLGHVDFLWKDPTKLLKDPVGALKLNEIELNPMGHIKNSIYQAAQRKDPMQQIFQLPMGLESFPGAKTLGLPQSTMGGTMVNGVMQGGMVHS